MKKIGTITAIILTTILIVPLVSLAATREQNISSLDSLKSFSSVSVQSAQISSNSAKSTITRVDSAADSVSLRISNIQRDGTQAQKDAAQVSLSKINTISSAIEGYTPKIDAELQKINDAAATINDAARVLDRISAGENVTDEEIASALTRARAADQLINTGTSNIVSISSEINSIDSQITAVKDELYTIEQGSFNNGQNNQILIDAANAASNAEDDAQSAENEYEVMSRRINAGERDTALQQELETLSRNAVAARAAANRAKELETQVKAQVASGNTAGAAATLASLIAVSDEAHNYSSDSSGRGNNAQTVLDLQKQYVSKVGDYELLAPFPISGRSERENETSFLGYIQSFYLFLISFSTVLAIFMIVLGGFQYMSTDVIGKKKDGLEKVRNAVIGLVLVLSSYLILYTINPEFVSLKNIFNQEGSSGSFSSGEDFGGGGE